MSDSCIVGIDYGGERIGVAVSDTAKKIAFSLDVIYREGTSYGLKRLKSLLTDRVIESFVVGLPYRENGNLGEEGREVLQYAESLEDYFGVKVITWDERYTTIAADKILRSNELNREGRKKVIDMIAAQLILQSYLDHLHAD